MDYSDFVEAIKHYGSTQDGISNLFLGIDSEKIHESVIIAPWWEPSTFGHLAEDAEFLVESANVRVWNLMCGGRPITYIKTGIGAPVLADVVLTLGLSNCKQMLFVGSVGGLDDGIAIGDIVIPEYSVCGDGVSRYLSGGRLKDSDTFGDKTFPDRRFYEKTKQISETECAKAGVALHVGRTFSIDTIFAQFAHIDEILEMGCNVIEMETAAAFKAAELASIPMAALFSVSDNTMQRKSLAGGRTKSDMQRRREIRRTVFPAVWEKLFEPAAM